MSHPGGRDKALVGQIRNISRAGVKQGLGRPLLGWEGEQRLGWG